MEQGNTEQDGRNVDIARHLAYASSAFSFCCCCCCHLLSLLVAHRVTEADERGAHVLLTRIRAGAILGNNAAECERR